MWFAENKSWSEYRRSLGGFSAIVCKDGSTVWAEDASGKTIASGEAGVDDASVIQSAVNALSNGGCLFIKQEDYLLNNVLNLENMKNIRITGENATLIVNHSSTQAFRLLNTHNIEIDHLTITLKTVDVAPSWFLELNPSFNSYIHHLRIDGLDGTKGPIGIRLFYGACRNIIAHNIVERCKEGIFFCGGTTDNPNEENIVANNICRYCGHNGIYADNYTHKLLIIGNQCLYNGQLQGDYFADYNGIEVMTNCYNVQIIGNICVGNYQPGIVIQNGVANFKICDNLLVDNGGGIYVGWGNGASNGIISDNYIKGNGQRQAGIWLYHCSNIIVNNNLITNNYLSGLFIDHCEDIESCENRLIENNLKEDPYYGEIMLQGSDTDKNKRIRIVYNYIKARSYTNNRGISTNGATRQIDIKILDNEIVSDNPIVSYDFVNFIIKRNFGFATENSGTATFSGDGTTTQFSIAHGLVSTPTKVLVTPMTGDAAADFYVTAGDTNIYINYKSAPPSGTDNLKFSWYAEV
ncbi:MAG: hypothetical protein DRJ43_06955 [Thermoprotei archaeon]|nr:MAG: hypothetical protein DRJ43_06955 [Thermoprotei archaeon]